MPNQLNRGLIGQIGNLVRNHFIRLSVDFTDRLLLKANKIIGGTEDNIVTIDEDGDIKDSTVGIDDVLMLDAVLGEDDEIVVTNNGDGTIAVSLPDSIKLDGATSSMLLATDANKKTVSVSDLTAWISGTTDEIDATDDGDGTMTMSLSENFLSDVVCSDDGVVVHNGQVIMI